jgi:hypothetical protein
MPAEGLIVMLIPEPLPPDNVSIIALSRFDKPSGSSGSIRSGRPASPIVARVPPALGITTPPAASGGMFGVSSEKPFPATPRSFVNEFSGIRASILKLFHLLIIQFSASLKLFLNPSHKFLEAAAILEGRVVINDIRLVNFVETKSTAAPRPLFIEFPKELIAFLNVSLFLYKRVKPVAKAAIMTIKGPIGEAISNENSPLIAVPRVVSIVLPRVLVVKFARATLPVSAPNVVIKGSSPPTSTLNANPPTLPIVPRANKNGSMSAESFKKNCPTGLSKILFKVFKTLFNVLKNISIDPESVTSFTNFANSIKKLPNSGKASLISSPIDWKIVVTSFS